MEILYPIKIRLSSQLLVNLITLLSAHPTLLKPSSRLPIGRGHNEAEPQDDPLTARINALQRRIEIEQKVGITNCLMMMMTTMLALM